jgi:cytochrome c peroxidase
MRRITWKTCVATATLVSPLMYCADRPTTAPAASVSRSTTAAAAPTVTPALVRQLAAGRGVVPLPPTPYVRPALARLGQALVFDKILSGNRDISCTTCHLPEFATGDARSLSIGQGATGLGPGRTLPSGIFIPRNAPPLFNIGAMRHLFWDGRVQIGSRGHLSTPAGRQLSREMRRERTRGTSSPPFQTRTIRRSGLPRGAGSARFPNIAACSRRPIRGNASST